MEGVVAAMEEEAGGRNGGSDHHGPCLTLLRRGPPPPSHRHSQRPPHAACHAGEGGEAVEPFMPNLARTRGRAPPPSSASPSIAFVAGAATVEAAR
jgi:hypothetical protein